MKNIRQQWHKVTIIGCVAFCIAAAIYIFFLAAIQNQGIIFQRLIVGSFLLGLALAIYRQYRWALRLTTGLFLLIAIFLPIGIFNPFTAGDFMVAGKEPASVVQTLLWLIPLEALILTIVFIIDPGKERTQHKKP